MRVTLETLDEEYFLDIFLAPFEITRLSENKNVIGEFIWPEHKIKRINLFLSQEKNIMPLVKGKKAKSRAGFSENIKREMEAGKPQKQAVAIAYSEARKGKKKK